MAIEEAGAAGVIAGGAGDAAGAAGAVAAAALASCELAWAGLGSLVFIAAVSLCRLYKAAMVALYTTAIILHHLLYNHIASFIVQLFCQQFASIIRSPGHRQHNPAS